MNLTENTCSSFVSEEKHINNTRPDEELLQEVGVPVSESIIERSLHQSKYSGFSTR